ncbi:MAG TPA: hypothetical protein VE619_06985, partial [Nitrososphaeraceae archaeon]|nr:hypothetical protein [Nitrososphaeraceae archaeon]
MDGDFFIYVYYFNGSSNGSSTHGHKQEKLKTKTAIMTIVILIASIFAVMNPLITSRQVYALTAGQRAQQNTPIPAELFASTINSGNPPKTDNFNIPKGYTIKPVLWNLTLPSSVAFDGKGNMFVAESGMGFGGLQPTPRILKIDTNGTISILTDRVLVGPITSIVYHQGQLYVANKAKISRVNPSNGATADIITGLPAGGDHPTNQIAFGADGRLYFAQGSATNSGVVGEDNYSPNLGW